MEQADLEVASDSIRGSYREPLIPKDLRSTIPSGIAHPSASGRVRGAHHRDHRSDYPVPLIEEWDLAIPSATVPPEAGLALLDGASGL